MMSSLIMIYGEQTRTVHEIIEIIEKPLRLKNPFLFRSRDKINEKIIKLRVSKLSTENHVLFGKYNFASLLIIQLEFKNVCKE